MVSGNTQKPNRWALEMILKIVCQWISDGRLQGILSHTGKQAVRQKRFDIYRNLMQESLFTCLVKQITLIYNKIEVFVFLSAQTAGF